MSGLQYSGVKLYLSFQLTVRSDLAQNVYSFQVSMIVCVCVKNAHSKTNYL
jgi:hypothetical protein